MDHRLAEAVSCESPKAHGDGSSTNLRQATFKMSTMPLGMKLPVRTGFVDFLPATELYEKGDMTPVNGGANGVAGAGVLSPKDCHHDKLLSQQEAAAKDLD
ncbi:hypothetical protein NDU88_006029 [Pleurodeles waltl]|uniref:Uncharacterized protein n=1 Tax=Pleurodeles waltl TaxID=8319 RepID=A0AAV7VLM5_PLEWA|nr:hypothetical protein NDU88_006029 [Pleurodeles waltl]